MKTDTCVTSEVILPGIISRTIESYSLAHAWLVAEYYSYYVKRVHVHPITKPVVELEPSHLG